MSCEGADEVHCIVRADLDFFAALGGKLNQFNPTIAFGANGQPFFNVDEIRTNFCVAEEYDFRTP